MRNRRLWARVAAITTMLLVAASCREEAPAPSGTQEGPAFQTLQEGTLQVGSCLDYKPFEFIEGGVEKGFDVDLSKAIAQELGLEVEWKRADFDTIFTAVAANQFDMVAAASTITEERDQVVDFSDPYYNARQSLAVNTQETPDVTSTDAIGDGDVIGVQKGTTGRDWAKENLEPQGAQIKTYTSITDAFRDLEAGRLTGIVNDEPSSQEIVKDLTGVEVVEAIDTGEHYGLAFSPDNPELREAVNGALATLIEDGRYAEIFGQYFPGVEVPPEFQPTS
ncbi:MAG TPA: basic amino acid ABC transporter substrate-binding protein [Actinomycetota bacterium]|nr:basic amino acid ABC transporter substrate-binding protein [Actinomycetota bacterium]